MLPKQAQIASCIAELDNLLAKDDEVWDSENKISKEDIAIMKALIHNFELLLAKEDIVRRHSSGLPVKYILTGCHSFYDDDGRSTPHWRSLPPSSL